MATVRAFLERVAFSGLMSTEEVNFWWKNYAKKNHVKSLDGVDVGAVARLLVEDKRLNAFQSRVLLDGTLPTLVLGEYELIGHIGDGGMGQVYLGRHRRMQRVVAVKILPPEMTKSAESVDRFQREVRAAAKLTHTNIVIAHDAGEWHSRRKKPTLPDPTAASKPEIGLLYLVTEYVDGTDLHRYVRQHGPLEQTQALGLVLQAARGLEYAHQRRVIHRDIKPSNILLDRAGHVKILDLGLARLTRDPDTGEGASEGLTAVSQIMGTVDYMAPEQALDTHQADERSDIYSLGATLFFLLTGHPMYEAESVMKRLVAHREARLPSVRESRSDVLPGVDHLLQRMVAKQPAKRPQHMSEIITELERLLSGIVAVVSEPTAKLSKAELHASLGELASEAAGSDLAVPHATGTPTPTTESDFFETQVSQSMAGAPPSQPVSAPSLTLPGRSIGGVPLWTWLLTLGLFFLVGASWLLIDIWSRSNRTTLVIDWPESERDGAKLYVDGEFVPVPERGPLKFTSQKSQRALKLVRPGFEPLVKEFNVLRGDSQIYAPVWKPTRATVDKQQKQQSEAELQAEFEALKKRVDELAQVHRELPNPLSIPIVQLRTELQALQGKLHEAAIDLLSRVPAPIDALQRDQHCSAEELEAAARGLLRADSAPELLTAFNDPAATAEAKQRAIEQLIPPQLVAILGDSRFKTWNGPYDVCFVSNDQVAVGAMDGTVTVFDATSGRARATLPIVVRSVASIAMSRDGRFLAAMHQNGDKGWPVEIWDLKTRRYVRTLKPQHSGGGLHHSRYADVAFDKEHRVITGGPDGLVKILHLETGEILRTLDGKVDPGDPPLPPVVSVAANQDGTLLASGHAQGIAVVWDARTGRKLHQLNGHTQFVNDVAFSPNGQWLATCDGDEHKSAGCVRIYDPQTGAFLRKLEQDQTHRFNAVVFSPDNRFIAAGGWPGHSHAYLWNTSTWGLGKKMSRHGELIWSVGFSPDSQSLASAAGDGGLKTFDLRPLRESLGDPKSVHEANLEATTGRASVLRTQVVSHDGLHLLGQQQEQAVRWNLATGKQEFAVHLPAPRILKHMHYDAAQQSLALATFYSGSLSRLRMLPDGRSLYFGTPQPTGQGIRSLAFTPDGSLSASGTDTGAVTIRDLDGQELRVIPAHAKLVNALAFAPTKRILATHGFDGVVRIWNPDTGDKLFEIPDQSANPEAIAFSPNGRYLATDSNGRVTLWRVTDGRQHRALDNAVEYGQVLQMAFSPDSKWLATSSYDGHVSLWDVTKGTRLQRLRLCPANGAIFDLSFTPDGRHLITSNGNGTHYVLRLQTWNNLPSPVGAALPKIASPSMPDKAPANMSDPDRAAAEWALKVPGGRHLPDVGIRVGSAPEQTVRPGEPLPTQPFVVTRINFRGLAATGSVRDDDLRQRVQPLRHLQWLWLQDCSDITDAGLAVLKNHPTLDNINVSGTQVTTAGMVDVVRALPALISVKVSRRQFGDELARVIIATPRLIDVGVYGGTDTQLRQLLPARHLTFLLFGGSVEGQAAQANLATWNEVPSAFPDLQYLYVTSGGSAIHDDHAAIFARCSKLDTLSVLGTSMSDKGLKALRECRALKNLELKQTQVTAAGVAEFHKALPQCRIEWDGGVLEPEDVSHRAADRRAAAWVLSHGGSVEVRVDGVAQSVRPTAEMLDRGARQPKVDQPDPRVSALLPAAPFALTGINLRDIAHVTSSTLEPLANLPHVWSLDLSGTALTDTALKPLRQLTSLEILKLSRTEITDRGLSELAPLKRLLDLDVSHTKVTGTAFGTLASLPHLHRLDLSNCHLSVDGAKHLSSLTHLKHLLIVGPQPLPVEVAQQVRSLRRLETLHLFGVAATDAELEQLAPLDQLTLLDLTNTPVTDRSVRSLPERHPYLQSLYLPGLPITDESVAECRKLNRLQTLMLHGTRVSDAGLKRLAGHPALKEISVNDTQVTANGKAEFLASLPLFRLARGDKELQQPHVAAVKWAIQHGGSAAIIELTEETQQTPFAVIHRTRTHGRVISKLEDLPQRPFAVWALYMNDRPITDAALAEVPTLDSLTALHLGSSPITDRSLTNMRRFKSLDSVSLAMCRGLTDACLDDLMSLKLRSHLYLMDTKQTSTGLDRAFVGQPQLRFMSTEQFPISGTALDRVRDSHRATRLCMAPQDLTAARVQRLARWPDLSSLRISTGTLLPQQLGLLASLPELNQIEFGDPANHFNRAAVEELKALPRLKVLTLVSATDADLERATELTSLTHMWLLQYGGPNTLSSRGLDALQRLPHLKAVYVINSQHVITAVAATRFRAALPHCELRVDAAK